MNDHVVIQNEFTRITEWNNAGFTGKGFTIWDMEPENDHGKKTKSRILDAVPDAKVINRTLSISTHNGEVNTAIVYNEDTHLYEDADEFVEKNNIKILSASIGRGSVVEKPGRAKWFNEFRDRHNLIMFNSAGNDGSEGVYPGFIPEESGIYVGACVMYQMNPEDIRIANYSSIGDEFEKVDFSSFTGWLSGTSFSTPYLAGTSALLIERYGDMSQDEIYNFFRMTAKPINTKEEPDVITEFPNGFYRYDRWSGYGVPVLPPLDKHYITMKIGQKSYQRDGQSFDMDTAPFIKDDRTFVPIAFIALALDAQVSWNAKSKCVTISKNNTVIQMFIDNTNYLLNGKPFTMETAPFIKDKRTFVPLSLIALLLNCRVSWLSKEKKILILE